MPKTIEWKTLTMAVGVLIILIFSIANRLRIESNTDALLRTVKNQFEAHLREFDRRAMEDLRIILILPDSLFLDYANSLWSEDTLLKGSM